MDTLCCTVNAVSLKTGKIIHTYQTSNFVSGAPLILPNETQLYVPYLRV